MKKLIAVIIISLFTTSAQAGVVEDDTVEMQTRWVVENAPDYTVAQLQEAADNHQYKEVRTALFMEVAKKAASCDDYQWLVRGADSFRIEISDEVVRELEERYHAACQKEFEQATGEQQLMDLYDLADRSTKGKIREWIFEHGSRDGLLWIGPLLWDVSRAIGIHGTLEAARNSDSSSVYKEGIEMAERYTAAWKRVLRDEIKAGDGD